MERILLYLDDLDDAICAMAFVGERGSRWIPRGVRRALLFLASSVTAWLALAFPTLVALLGVSVSLRFARRAAAV